uniref:C2H2-type domain-containing protein n=1 Tax=Rhodnius prolixus TaxID=13249 RepID=T1IAX9_RHOPR
MMKKYIYFYRFLSDLLPACTANPPIKGLDNGNSSSAAESHMQTDHIKQTNSASLTILDLQPAEAIYLDKAKKKRTFCLTGKAIIRYYTENRVKGNVWYQCSSCPFISVRKSSIAQHCIISHDGNNKIGISSNVQMYKCLACDNIFSSTHSLKVHYLYDHNSTNEEIEEILKLSIETNKHLKGINSSFAPIKPDVSAVSEKNIEITVPTSNYGDTVQQVHEDQHPVEVINHSTAQFFPFFFSKYFA